MDIDNDNERPNSSSSTASRSSSNSSSNLLVNLPMLPMLMQSQQQEEFDMEVIGTVGEGERERDDERNVGEHERDMSDDDIHSNAANIVAPPPCPPSPTQSLSQLSLPLLQPLLPPPPPPPTATETTTTTSLASSNQLISSDIANNDSIFVSPLLYNNNSNTITCATITTTTNPSSSSSSSTTTTPPHQEHFALSSSHQLPPQNHALSSLPLSSSSTSSSSSLAHLNIVPNELIGTVTGIETNVPIVRQEEELHSQIDRSFIADTIDASVIVPATESGEVPIVTANQSQVAAPQGGEAEDDDGDVVITAENISTGQYPNPSQHSSLLQRRQSQSQLTTTLQSSDVTFGITPRDSEFEDSSPPSPTLPPISATTAAASAAAAATTTTATTTTSSLPSSTLQEDEEERNDDEEDEDDEDKRRQDHSYRSFFNYPSAYGNAYSNYSAPYRHSNHNKFSYGYSSNTIGGTIATMFNSSSNDNNSAGAGGSSSSGNGGNGLSHRHHQAVDRIKMLYPNVNENETPLPRCWSPHDKCLSIKLLQNNLRVHYKGGSKQHSTDAASVRTAHPIPPACGLYYFEVKIISKGKNGYMGIGLTAQQFRMNRLPGWDKQSYGYHGDDGNSFSSSGNGQSYGPTFTTGDVIGCCVNFVNNTCFYTKNGIDLGIAFRDLPTRLYPTVGLQTPGEEVDANFGQEPFKFDQIEDMMKQMRAEMSATIYNFPMPADQGDSTTLLHKMVSSYLVHNGYSQTAEAFARATSQTFREDISSIRNRQKILKLVMSGRMGQAIEHTLRSYPGLLENNKNLWFMLKCRQFIEMVNGSDIEYCPNTNNKSAISNTTQTTQTTPPNQTSVIQSTKTYQNGKSTTPPKHQNSAKACTGSVSGSGTVINNSDFDAVPNIVTTRSFFPGDYLSNSKSNEDLPANLDYINDVEMDNNGHNNSSNGDSYQNGNSANHFNNSIDLYEDMDVDAPPAARKYSQGIERILEFGKELSQMGQLLEKENKMKDEDRQMLEDAFSLIAYSNPWSSPLGWQLCPTKRENVCTALNSAILESLNYPRRPPLDICVGHANELLRTMAQASLGACAFVNVEDIFPQN